MTIYNAGSITVSNGSSTVTGDGTAFNGVVYAGWLLIMPDRTTYVVQNVVSDTELSLTRPYIGSSVQGSQDYELVATKAMSGFLAAQVTNLIQNFQAVVNGPGAGVFAQGDVSTPGIRFEGDQDTGFARTASNKIGVVTGGILRAIFGSTFELNVPLTGTAAQSSRHDATSGRLLKTGAFGLGGAAPRNDHIGYTDFDELIVGGIYTITGDLTNGPSGSASTEYTGVLTVAQRELSAGPAVVQTLVLGDLEPIVYRRQGTGDPIGFGDWFSAPLISHSGEMKLTAASIFSGRFLVANDAVGVIDGLSEGGRCTIISKTSEIYPQLDDCGEFMFDTGVSPSIRLIGGGSTFVVSDSLTLTGSTGADGNTTVSVAAGDGTITVENRSGVARTIQYIIHA